MHGSVIKVAEVVDRWRKQGGSPPHVQQALSPHELSVRHANGQRFITNVTTLLDMCRRHKVALVLITFISDEAHMTSLFYRESIKYYNQLLRDLAASEHILLNDLEQQFLPLEAKETYFFSDHYHPSQRGARWIAETVAREMDNLL